MRQMKDSGIEWIGQIPEEWEVRRLSTLISLESGCPISSNDISNEGLYPIFGGNGIRGYTNSYYIDGNFILIGRQGAQCGNIHYTLGKIWATEHALIVKSITEINKKFLYFLLISMNLNQYSTTAAQPGLSAANIRKKYICYPSLDEQQRIADYLDAQCARIDETMELVRQSSEKLRAYKLSLITEAVTKGLDPDVPMKDSGVPWIGEIPQRCKCVAVNKLFTLILGKMLADSPKSESDTFEQYLCAINIHFDGIDDTNLKKMWFSQKEKSLYKVKDGDLLIVEGGAGAGGAFIAENMCNKNIYIQNSIIIAREKKKISSAKFLYYAIYSFVKRNYIDFICNKATIPHFTKEKIGNTKIVLFPLPEQQRIAAYLGEKCARIDALLAEKDELLDKLAEYKKSLIFECVTGKREVAA